MKQLQKYEAQKCPEGVGSGLPRRIPGVPPVLSGIAIRRKTGYDVRAEFVSGSIPEARFRELEAVGLGYEASRGGPSALDPREPAASCGGPSAHDPREPAATRQVLAR